MSNYSKFILLLIAQQIVFGYLKIMSSHDKRTKRSITTTDKASSAGSKKVFDPELESFTKRTRFESSHNRDSLKTQKLTFDKLLENILFALDRFYSDDESGFYANCKQFLAKGIDSWKLKIVDRMNTYEYVQLAIGYKPYSDIETEIIKEWKKNYLLFAIMTYWYNGIQKIKFQSLKHFQKKYDVYCEFVAQISALIFRGWLNNWEKRLKNKEINALDKIYEQTTHMIITDSSEFKKVYEKILLPLIQYETHGKNVQWKYNLEELKAKKGVFDLEKQQNLPKTIEVLRKFSKQVKLTKKIDLLRQYRSTLQSQLISQCNLITKNNSSKGYQVLQKDDYINAIIYCIVKGRLQDLQSCMIYMQTILGENLQMLSKLQINSFAIDLIAAIGFLCEKRPQYTDDEEQFMRSEQFMPLHNKFISSPQIPADNEDFTFGMKKNFTEKHITEFELKQ